MHVYQNKPMTIAALSCLHRHARNVQ